MNIDRSALNDTSDNDDDATNLNGPLATQEVGKVRSENQASNTTNTLDSVEKTLCSSGRMVEVCAKGLVLDSVL